VASRLQLHRAELGARHTALRLPVELGRSRARRSYRSQTIQ
jgi:hypothetical protein